MLSEFFAEFLRHREEEDDDDIPSLVRIIKNLSQHFKTNYFDYNQPVISCCVRLKHLPHWYEMNVHTVEQCFVALSLKVKGFYMTFVAHTHSKYVSIFCIQAASPPVTIDIEAVILNGEVMLSSVQPRGWMEIMGQGGLFLHLIFHLPYFLFCFPF